MWDWSEGVVVNFIAGSAILKSKREGINFWEKKTKKDPTFTFQQTMLVDIGFLL